MVERKLRDLREGTCVMLVEAELPVLAYHSPPPEVDAVLVFPNWHVLPSVQVGGPSAAGEGFGVAELVLSLGKSEWVGVVEEGT